MSGDAWLGDIYCLAEHSASVARGAWGCVYGASIDGKRSGPVIYQSNKEINTDGGVGGPGIVMWSDRENADKFGNQGYMDIWAWGNGHSNASNSISFGNRGSGGKPSRRMKILNDGRIQFPDLAGIGNPTLCVLIKMVYCSEVPRKKVDAEDKPGLFVVGEFA